MSPKAGVVLVPIAARIGQRPPLGWEFHGAMACLSLSLAFPGFVGRSLRRRRNA